MSGETGHETHLASVLDLYEMNLVTALFYNENVDYNPQDVRALAWVGLSGYKLKDTKTVKWSWTDGYPIVFTKWANGEPATGSIQVEPGKSCVYIDEGKKRKNVIIHFKSTLGQSHITKALWHGAKS